MTHELYQFLIGLSVALGLSFLVILFVINGNFIYDFKETRRIYKDFCKNEYQYKGHYGSQIWFSRNDEADQSYQFNEMVFFNNDGGIKLRENYYIHKGFLTFKLVHRYYYRKFHRVKEQYIHRHQMSERFRNLNGVWVRNQFVKSKEFNSFKFLRG